MSENSVAERRNWFRFFPEGSIEFIVVTRVLALLLLLALAIVKETQRPLALLALAGVLWIDYLLTLWWAVQLVTDLDALGADVPPPAGALQRRRIGTALVAALPATAVFLILAPWPDFVVSFSPLASWVRSPEAFRTVVSRVVFPLLGVLFVVSLLPAYRALRRVELGPRPWMLLLLIPIVHWFALHRLLVHWHRRLGERLREQGGAGPEDSGSGPTVILADITWVGSVLPWGVVLVVFLLRGEWPTTPLLAATPICGSAVAGLFAVANTAAMEQVQRQFVALIRR